MKDFNKFAAGISTVLFSGTLAMAEVHVVAEYNDNAFAAPEFKFPNVPPPSSNDGATTAKLTIVSGEPDPSSGGVNKLNNGKVPDAEDQPEENFFFRAGTDGGRILFDLNSATDIRQINTYSWHPGSRGPQIYTLYASAGDSPGFNPQPGRNVDPESCGWKKTVHVDTRPKSGDYGGQYGVSITGTIGTNRYLLFDFFRTESDDAFGNTFYSEIDVVDKNTKPEPVLAAVDKPFVVVTAGGRYEIAIDTSQAGDLTDWADHKLAPVLAEWYPKIVAMLPSDGYVAPKRFGVTIKPGRGVAATSGTRITANASWIKSQIDGEATGSLIHEMVHVVQQYGRSRSRNSDAAENPGWLVEGIADYIRWYKYQPESHGADIKPSAVGRARHDGSYRTTANFLNWVIEKHDKNIVKKLNAAMRNGKYNEKLWQDYTGMTGQRLDEEWKKNLENLPAPHRG